MKKIIFSFLLVLTIFTLAACGKEKNSQGVFDDKVVVGNTVATSGSLSFVGVPFKAGMDAYFKMVNDDGGVAGRKIEYKQYDDGFDAATGQTYTQKLVEDDKVFALVGHFGTPTVGATQEYLDEIGIPRVYYATGISSLFQPNATGGAKGSFPVQPIYDAEGEVMVARVVNELKAKRIGVIYSNADDGKGILNGIKIKAAELKVEIVNTVQVASNAVDMSAAAQIMISSNVDAIIVAANQTPAATAVRALDDASNTIPVITSYVNADATWLTQVADAIDSFDIYGNAWIAVDLESDDYKTFAKEVGSTYAANSFAYAGWIAAATFVEGLKRVGKEPLTWDSFIKAMESKPVELPFGVVVDYANSRRVGTQAMSLLKASKVDGTPAWVVAKPIQTITEILGE